MSETEHEHDDPDEAAGAPVSPETAVEGEADEDEANEAERAAREPTEASEGEGDEPENVGTQARARQSRDEQKAIDRKFEKYEKEATRHAARVAEIGEEEAQDFLQCPMCAPEPGQPNLVGWLQPVKPSEEKIANVRAAIGLAPKIDYRDDPHSRVCPTCGGLKSVRPAGGDDTTPLLTCATCNANGWIPTDEVRGGAPTNGEVAKSLQTGPLAPPTLEPDSPEVAALKAAGYTVIAPYTMPAS